MRTQTPLRVHWVRHGKVSSHQGDVSVTDDGLEQAEAVGRQLAEEISPDEDIFFLYAPTRRTRQTAVAIRNGIEVGLGNADVQVRQHRHLFSSTEHRALRSPDLY